MANSPVMNVEVLRYNPEIDQEPHLSTYQVPYDNQTISFLSLVLPYGDLWFLRDDGK